MKRKLPVLLPVLQLSCFLFWSASNAEVFSMTLSKRILCRDESAALSLESSDPLCHCVQNSSSSTHYLQHLSREHFACVPGNLILWPHWVFHCSISKDAFNTLLPKRNVAGSSCSQIRCHVSHQVPVSLTRKLRQALSLNTQRHWTRCLWFHLSSKTVLSKNGLEKI